jgi:hypothetical protein
MSRVSLHFAFNYLIPLFNQHSLNIALQIQRSRLNKKVTSNFEIVYW